MPMKYENRKHQSSDDKKASSEFACWIAISYDLIEHFNRSEMWSIRFSLAW